jgi:outer membrane receptor for ferrienterochelin and colicins
MSSFDMRSAVRAAIVFAPLAVSTAFADDAVDTGGSSDLSTIIVTARRLDEERSRIETQTGATVYTVDQQDLAAEPGADNQLLNQVMLQLPDTAQDTFGQLHVRGDHNGLQFRLNGVILPDGISFFGQTLSPRIIESLQMVTGSLPAQYGLRSAAIIDLTTKSGEQAAGGDVSLYGGSHGEVNPSFSYGGNSGQYTYFATGDFLRNDLGIESQDASSNPLHDHTTQYHGFAYAEDILDEHNRVSVMAGLSDTDFQIPTVFGQSPSLGLVVNGVSDFPSQDLNENQREVTQFGAVSWQHSDGPLSLQTSFLARNSTLHYVPDELGDLLYTGLTQDVYKKDTAYSLQADGSYKLNDAHTVRAGAYLQYDRLTSNATSTVLPTDDNGVQTSDVPLPAIFQGSFDSQVVESAYVQDEWSIVNSLTLNYGLRFDHYNAFSSGSQLSPRANFVWVPIQGTTLHAGYSRFFSPPPFELVTTGDFVPFNNTTAPGAPLGGVLPPNDPVKPERSNYYDLGIQQVVFQGFTVGVDSYYKQSTDLIDEGQFGSAVVLTPFNYAHGQVYGFELTGSYTVGAFSAYGNIASQRAIGKDIVSAEFNFAPDELEWIASHYIHLDHEQQVSASGGVSYTLLATRFSVDAILGSGLRTDLELSNPVTLSDGDMLDHIPNGDRLPYYTQINLGMTHDFSHEGIKGLSARFDVINVADKIYEIRDGAGVGVGLPAFGPRRGFFGGVTWSF